jgi:hypothetical protein
MNANKPEPEDEESDASELDTASDRAPHGAKAPEIPAKLESLTEWDQPVDAAGDEVPKVLPEDETSAAEELVEEGIEEADRDQRIAAVDPDFEP